MNILFLGGTSFIGLHTVINLFEKGHNICVFHRGKHNEGKPEKVKSILGDKKDIYNYREEFKKFSPDIIVDMVPFSDETSKPVIKTFKDVCRRVVAISSCDVYLAYGIINKSEPEKTPVQNEIITEESPLRTEMYPYKNLSERMKGYDKILAEKEYIESKYIDETILRLPMVYGENDYQHRLFPYLKRIDDGRKNILLDKLTSNWKSCRAYAKNVAEAIALAVTKPQSKNNIYNVAEPYNYTEKQWVEKIKEITKWQGNIIIPPENKLPVEESLKQHLAVDSGKIRKDLGYKELINLNNSLKNTIEWERKNPPENINDDMFNYKEEDKILSEL